MTLRVTVAQSRVYPARTALRLACAMEGLLYARAELVYAGVAHAFCVCVRADQSLGQYVCPVLRTV